MKYFVAIFAGSLIYLLILVNGCRPHYEQINGDYYYVQWDEGTGKRKHPLKNSDSSSFEIIDRSYAKDKKRVYINGLTIYDANPAQFKPLGFPYSTDGKTVYCGNVPMNGIDIESFTVTYEHAGLTKYTASWIKTNLSENKPIYDDKTYIFSNSVANDRNGEYRGPRLIKRFDR
ncbi:MAG: DKNYY domain-containing protein [Planctomycetota bacterium]